MMSWPVFILFVLVCMVGAFLADWYGDKHNG